MSYFTDAISEYYLIGDLIDMRDRECGAWFEGKIVRIVLDPQAQHKYTDIGAHSSKNTNSINGNQSDSENIPPGGTTSNKNSKLKRKGITKYFMKAVINKKPAPVSTKVSENDLLFKIELDE